jgi:hypothetical protein
VYQHALNEIMDLLIGREIMLTLCFELKNVYVIHEIVLRLYSFVNLMFNLILVYYWVCENIIKNQQYCSFLSIVTSFSSFLSFIRPVFMVNRCCREKWEVQSGRKFVDLRILQIMGFI